MTETLLAASGDTRLTQLRPFTLPTDRAPYIGVSGGIGTGKSTVAALLRERGAVVADADALARQVVQPGSQGLAYIVEAFGHQILHADSSLDRGALAALIFADPDKRRQVEAITHPLIAQEARRIRQSVPADGVAVYDVPLLVEANMAGQFDVVVMIHAATDRRIDRLMRRGMTEQDARRRIAQQATVEQRRQVTHLWIDNDGTEEDLRTIFPTLWQMVTTDRGDH